MQSFQKENVKVHLDTQHHLLRLEMSGVVSTAAFKELYLKASDIAYDYAAMRWLVVQSEVRSLHPECEQWILKEYFPMVMQKFKRMGRFCCANVLSKAFFAEMSAKRASEQLLNDRNLNTQYVEIRNFFDEPSALQWILQA
ncbi:MAG: hypothetical protein OHK0053_07020 [Microscillaceae bacterium]